MLSPLASLSIFPVAVRASACSVTIVHENNTNNAIQQALDNAAAGITGPVVCVEGGVYPEQLNITSAGGISLVGLGTFSNPTVVIPSTVVVNSYDPNTNAPQAPIILVGNGTSTISNVTIRNIVVNGSIAGTSSFSGCSVDFMGILYLNAGGTVTNNTVTDIFLGQNAPNLFGCQDGQGVYVQTTSGNSDKLVITKNVVTNYQKNGITCNDVGTTCIVKSNVVFPYAPATSYIAPNGIQIGFGAVGSVSLNTVSGNICNLPSVCGPNLVTQTEGTGILTFESGLGTNITKNILVNNGIGLASALDSVNQNQNKISGSVAAGILQYDGTYKALKNSLISNLAGIAILSDGFGPNVTSTLGSRNQFSGNSFLVEILTLSPGIATVHFDGRTYNVSGNSNITIT